MYERPWTSHAPPTAHGCACVGVGFTGWVAVQGLRRRGPPPPLQVTGRGGCFCVEGDGGAWESALLCTALDQLAHMDRKAYGKWPAATQ